MDPSSLASPPKRIRKAFVMAVNPGQADEYARRHNPIWPELASVLKEHGVHNYSIFYYPTTRQLFAYVELEDEARWAAVGRTPVCRQWWEHMSEIMPSNEDLSPASAKLNEVFHLA
jgi:L-rhamnose mutarotase